LFVVIDPRDDVIDCAIADGDDSLFYDTVERKYGSLGKVMYGVGNAAWLYNGSHVIGLGGEPSHQHNMNAESAVQIASVLV
jgi:hypothetical protein